MDNYRQKKLQTNFFRDKKLERNKGLCLITTKPTKYNNYSTQINLGTSAKRKPIHLSFMSGSS